ncbi:MAG: L-aspartate oxidase [Gammaproteobacteria bacterium]|nr:L-aspartate oxidase [Gammaproteobacteria bacterium]
MSHQYDLDVLILGSGAAGLSAALRLAERHRVGVVTKGRLTESNTLYAQGGISAVLDEEDSVASHVEDTIDAGAGLCNRDVVQYVVERGHQCVRWLQDLGAPFTTRTGAGGRTEIHLTREGGHSHRRVVHAADATGHAVETTLESHVRAHPNIRLFENHLAIDLILAAKLGLGYRRCLGAYVFDRANQRVETFGARFTILATGGAGKVYLYTTNPDVATGDGIAMAWRAGCRVANMEFIQFHPTCLYHPKAKTFLITEAVRGEGGRLLLPNGEPFMHRFDARGELAPRDIVARAIDHEMKRLGADCLYLDISHKDADFIREHFPTVHGRCMELGIDMTRQPIPIVPATHFLCGGVVSDINGRTDLPGLYAIGEVACTGLHGANRLASNSLLECCVMAAACTDDIRNAQVGTSPVPALPPWDESQVTDSDEEVVVSHNWEELRRFMWDYVGIVRTTKRMQRALRRAQLLHAEIAEYYGNFRVTNDLIELRNLVQVAELIIHSATLRRESRGLHYTLDYPERDDRTWLRDTILCADTLISNRRAASL